jgi:hypothetical protein
VGDGFKARAEMRDSHTYGVMLLFTIRRGSALQLSVSL